MPTSPEFVVGGCPAKVTQQLQKGLPAVNESECDFYQSLSVKFAECISLAVEETVDSVEVVPDNRTGSDLAAPGPGQIFVRYCLGFVIV